MPSYPTLKQTEVISILKFLGFTQIREKGSHKQFNHPDGRHTTVATHSSRDVYYQMIAQIANDIRMHPKDFIALKSRKNRKVFKKSD